VIILLLLLFPPLKPPLIVTSGFGSYRKGHFHAGIDLSTGRRIGIPLYAVGDGEIVRIRASHTGYGKALYLRLENGDVILYAHLERFNRRLERLLYDYQKRMKSYRVDIFLEEPISVKEGELIAFSGATGYGPPHLHLEWRRKGLFATDPTEKLGRERVKLRIQRVLLRSVRGIPYEAMIGREGDTVEVASPFRLWAEINSPRPKGGWVGGIPSRIYLLFDGDTAFTLNFAKIKPSGMGAEALYRVEEGIPFIALFRPQQLVWEPVRGLIHLNPPLGVHTVSILLENGSHSDTFQFFVKTIEREEASPSILRWDWEWNGVRFRFFERGAAIFGKVQVSGEGGVVSPIETSKDSSLYWLSDEGKWKVISRDTLTLFSFYVKDSFALPLILDGENYLIIKMESGSIADPFLLWRILLPEESEKEELIQTSPSVIYYPEDPLLRSPIKVQISPLEKSGVFIKKSRRWRFLCKEKGKTWDLGEFALMRDTIPPKVKRITLRKDLLLFKVWDGGSGVDPDGIEAYLDRRWIPVAYDPDDGTLKYRPLKSLRRGNHLLQLTLRDMVGNTKRLRFRFYTR
jgi:hypothetical protein